MLEYGPKVGEALADSVSDRPTLINKVKSAAKAMPGVPPDEFAKIIEKTPVDDQFVEALSDSELTEEQVR